jgi:hypothetical protein
MSVAIATVRAAIVTKLEAVSGIGRVHPRRRLIFEMAEEQEHLHKDGRLHFWCVMMARANPFRQQRLGSGQSQATVRWQIEAWYAFRDAENTEETFENLVEDVVGAFEADARLESILGQSNRLIEGGPLDVEADELAFYPRENGTLCHYARLTLPTRFQTRP